MRFRCTPPCGDAGESLVEAGGRRGAGDPLNRGLDVEPLREDHQCGAPADVRVAVREVEADPEATAEPHAAGPAVPYVQQRHRGAALEPEVDRGRPQPGRELHAVDMAVRRRHADVRALEGDGEHRRGLERAGRDVHRHVVADVRDVGRDAAHGQVHVVEDADAVLATVVRVRVLGGRRGGVQVRVRFHHGVCLGGRGGRGGGGCHRRGRLRRRRWLDDRGGFHDRRRRRRSRIRRGARARARARRRRRARHIRPHARGARGAREHQETARQQSPHQKCIPALTK